MARISGVDLPRNKRVEVALTYIYGIGRITARSICAELKIPDSKRTDGLTDEDIVQIRAHIDENLQVEGDLRREKSMALKRLMELGCYRGLRHRKGLPVRGQSTRQNARTRKGPKKTVANKKKAVK